MSDDAETKLTALKASVDAARRACNAAIAEYERIFQEYSEREPAADGEDYDRGLSLGVAQVEGDDTYRWVIMEVLSLGTAAQPQWKVGPAERLAALHRDFRDAMDRKYEELEEPMHGGYGHGPAMGVESPD